MLIKRRIEQGLVRWVNKVAHVVQRGNLPLGLGVGSNFLSFRICAMGIFVSAKPKTMSMMPDNFDGAGYEEVAPKFR